MASHVSEAERLLRLTRGLGHFTVAPTIRAAVRLHPVRFGCGRGGLSLLRGLVSVNKRLLACNAACFAGVGATESGRQKQ